MDALNTLFQQQTVNGKKSKVRHEFYLLPAKSRA